MTNAEKFEEVFGFEPSEHSCVRLYCVVPDIDAPIITDCKQCCFDFWNGEYKPPKKGEA